MGMHNGDGPAPDMNAPDTDEWSAAAEAVALKCDLLADGIRIDQGALPVEEMNLTRRHLYDYGMTRSRRPLPYELVLTRLPSFGGLPIVARVRHNENAAWELVLREGTEFLRNARLGTERPVHIPKVMDFRGHRVHGRDLSTVVQRLGYDLIGVVPTNHCSYYTAHQKCAFCEIVETFDDEAEPGTPYRKNRDLILTASEMAAGLDDTITGVTYNGGQLADYDATVRMYVQLVAGLRRRSSTAALDTTVACMPPLDLKLVGELKSAGLDQIYFNVETLDERLLRSMAPAKSRFGLDRMLTALKAALVPFGPGRVYTNLVYGIQSLKDAAPPTHWHSEQENRVTLAAMRRLAEAGIVPTYTVYHSSGRNATGRIPLSPGGLLDFTQAYGELVWHSGLIDRSRKAVLFTVGSLPNTTYNDGWLLAELSRGRTQA
ncbi:radical SAM protein [Streptomyces sp. SID89]|nr:radical SAM protein [Streptomyces sp. SID89]